MIPIKGLPQKRWSSFLCKVNLVRVSIKDDFFVAPFYQTFDKKANIIVIFCKEILGLYYAKDIYCILPTDCLTSHDVPL